MRKIAFSLCIIISIMFLSSTVSYAWGSSPLPEVLDTHKMIAEQSLIILANDMNKNESLRFKQNFSILKLNLKEYKKGIVAPDFGKIGSLRQYSYSQDHFYNPDTGKNFTYNPLLPLQLVDTTAESQTRNYIGQAVALWKEGKYQNATFILGAALHFFSDLNQPQHAANIIGPIHSKFENYVDSICSSLRVKTIGYDTSKGEYKDSYTKYPYITDFITAYAKKYAKLAKNLSAKALSASSDTDFAYAAKIGTKNTQISNTIVIYRFLKEVSNEIILPTSPPSIGKFFVVISTANEKFADTSDDVYFDIEFKNGRQFEYLCKLPLYNFKKGFKTAYEFNIPDAKFNAKCIKKVWIRKSNILKDAWQPNKVEIYIKGSLYLKKDLKGWITKDSNLKLR